MREEVLALEPYIDHIIERFDFTFNFGTFGCDLQRG